MVVGFSFYFSGLFGDFGFIIHNRNQHRLLTFNCGGLATFPANKN